MTDHISHTRLGVFIVAAIALLVALAISLGGGNTFRKKVTVETYFDESVQGLDIGSKVRYRGVVIGAVSSINFTYTRYELDKSLSDRKQYVLVEMAVYPELLGTHGGDDDFVGKLVADGLRIRMAPIGITGIAYLELDFSPRAAVLPVRWQPANLYIPSVRSTVLNFVDAAERILGRLATLDLEGTVQRLDRLLQTLERKAGAIDTEALTREATAALNQLRGTLAKVDRLAGADAFKDLPADLAATVHRLREIAESPELRRTLAALDRSSQRMDQALDGREQDIAELIGNLRSASANLKHLSETLQRDPGAVLLAPAPPQSRVYQP